MSEGVLGHSLLLGLLVPCLSGRLNITHRRQPKRGKERRKDEVIHFYSGSWFPVSQVNKFFPYKTVVKMNLRHCATGWVMSLLRRFYLGWQSQAQLAYLKASSQTQSTHINSDLPNTTYSNGTVVLCTGIGWGYFTALPLRAVQQARYFKPHRFLDCILFSLYLVMNAHICVMNIKTHLIETFAIHFVTIFWVKNV
jgi:hypothetical protein